MNLIDRYSKADPVPVAVTWPIPASEALRTVGAAIAVERFATVPGGDRLVYRVQGTANGRRLDLRVSASATHIGSSPAYSVRGDVRDLEDGSRFSGALVLPGAASKTWPLVLAAFAVIGVLLVVGGMPEALPLWAMGFVPLLFAPELRGRALRRRARDIEAILASLATPQDDRNLTGSAASG